METHMMETLYIQSNLLRVQPTQFNQEQIYIYIFYYFAWYST